jgi:hypothetical protein
MRGIGIVVAACIALAVAPFALGGDDEAWRLRIEKELRRVEVGVSLLDEQKPTSAKIVDRVRSLDARLAALEKGAGIAVGRVVGEDDLGTLSQDVAVLNTRWRLVVAAKTPKPEPPAPKPPAPPKDPKEPADPKKKDPAGKKPEREWPSKVAFKATAKIVYAETGEWFLTKARRSGVGDDFLMDGYRGRISFTLRAANLLRDVKGVKVRVAVRMKAPFTDRSDVYRTYDIEWNASNNVFGNDSIKSWVNHDDVVVSGPVRWIAKPQQVTSTLDVEAHVVSAVQGDGRELTFEVPEYATR